MMQLSTGGDSTLGNYLDISARVFGEDSKAVKYLKEKIEKSPHGRDEEVIAPEGQMIYMLMSLNKKE